jgi:hypothetical protein
VSLSGLAFAFHGKEAELLNLIQWVSQQNCVVPVSDRDPFSTRRGEPPLSDAAVDAVVRLVSDGGPTERQALVDAGVFGVAISLYKSGSARRLSHKLLLLIIQHMARPIVTDEQLISELIYLFESVC